MKRTIAPAGLLVAALAPAASAQLSIVSHVITAGGTTTPLAAGPYTMQSSIGDPLAGGGGSSGQYGLGAGFFQGGGPPPCYANCDNSTAAPILNVNDFVCFQAQFAAGNAYANCDHSTTPPVLNVNDFICFQGQFAAGCP